MIKGRYLVQSTYQDGEAINLNAFDSSVEACMYARTKSEKPIEFGTVRIIDMSTRTICAIFVKGVKQ